jgi:hypothetical protein
MRSSAIDLTMTPLLCLPPLGHRRITPSLITLTLSVREFSIENVLWARVWRGAADRLSFVRPKSTLNRLIEMDDQWYFGLI